MEGNDRMLIYHIIPRLQWEQAQAAGTYSAASLATEGFIHASTREQVADTANRYYHGQPGLMLLAIDPEKTSAEVRFDPVERDGVLTHFPHIYGPLNLDAVLAAAALPPQPDGSFTFPAELA
jgi:uncharacterized protein (DUF952 family)